MVAALGMYDRLELQESNNALWSAIRSQLGFGPDQLDRDTDLWDIWQNQDLVLAQTCGLPYRARLHDRVQLVGTPDYGLPDCPPGYYNSVFVTRKGEATDLIDYRSRIFAYNEALSQSGWAAAQVRMGEFRYRFNNFLQSGSHLNSARAVVEKTADIASLDAISWRLICKYEDFSKHLQVIDTTSPTPGLPLITAKKQNSAKILSAVRRAIKSIYPIYRRTLGIQGIIQIPKADYMSIPTPRGP